MSTRSIPNLRRIKLHALTHPCPEAGGRSRTVRPKARLERWAMLRDLVVDAWSNPQDLRSDLVDRHLSALSPIEADLIRRMFLNIERILPIPAEATVDLEGRSVSHDDDEAGISTSVHLTFTIEHPDGTIEHVRLKTGRRASSPEEAAVVWASAEPGETFADLMAWPGEVEPIEAPTDLEERLRSMVEGSPALTRSGIRPGRACVWCDRSATCGAFPAERVVPTNARTVTLTKTDVEDLGRCERRVAWRRVHGIPRDDGDEADSGSVVSKGRLFHALVGAAHGEGDEEPDAAAVRYLDGVPPSEVADLAAMWDAHRHLLRQEGLTVRASEFPVGVTVLYGDNTSLHGVTIIGFVDLTARDGEGRPVAVEIKTGSPADTGVEDDLYTVGMRRWIGDDVPLVVHRHHVGPTTSGCQVVEVAPDQVAAARDRLHRRVEPVQHWEWDDPLQPDFTVGAWCGGCEFRGTCESYR